MNKHFGSLNMLTILKCCCVILVLSLFLEGCAPRSISVLVPNDLLSKDRSQKPLKENSILVTVNENPQIDTRWRIEESIKSAIESSLKNSNMFGSVSTIPYELIVDIVGWYQPLGDFGMFTTTMKTHYVLRDERKNIILDEEIVTEASSDTFHFMGRNRAMAATKMTVLKNVNQFLDILKKKIGFKPIGIERNDNKKSISEELQRLSELHSSGKLTDEEFKKAKDILLDKK